MLNAAERTNWCSRDAYIAICATWKTHPELLTDDDLGELEHPNPDNARRARGDRDKAQAKLRTTVPAAAVPAAAPAPATVTTTEAQRSAALVAAGDYLDTTERREAVFERLVSGVELADEEYELIAQPVPAYALLALDKFVTDINENNKMRNARIEALEQKHADLEAIAGPKVGERLDVLEQRATTAEEALDAVRTRSVHLETELFLANTRVKALEHDRAARPGWRDAGVWSAGREYEVGDVVTYRSSGWVCNAKHVATGRDLDHRSFRLFVKGRDRQ